MVRIMLKRGASARSLRRTLLTFVMLTAALAVSCGGEDDGPAAPGPEATSATPQATVVRPQPTAAALPAEVDKVIKAVQASDHATLALMVRFTPAPCEANPTGIGGGPPCATKAATVPPGSMIDVLPASFCEGGYLLRPDVPGFLQQQVEPGRLRYYGTQKAAPGLIPPLKGDYAVLFSLVAQPDFKFVAELDDGSIVALGARGICGGAVPPPADPAWLQPPR